MRNNAALPKITGYFDELKFLELTKINPLINLKINSDILYYRTDFIDKLKSL